MRVVNARRALTCVLVCAMAMLGGAVLASSASAKTKSRDGRCDSGEFCLYFHSGNKGAISDFRDSVDDYGKSQPRCYDFKGTKDGHGKCVKNNTAAVWNRTSRTVRVFYNSNFAGPHQDIKPRFKGNLNSSVKNKNASHEFLTSGPTGCHTDGTDSKRPSTILVYRTGSHRVERVDFKTYVKNVLPNEWPASWRRESLRAGAVAVKNFGWYHALHSIKKTSDGRCFDVYDSTASQVYRPGSATASTNAAVNDTWGTRVLRNGHILQTQFCSNAKACGHRPAGSSMSQTGSQQLAGQGKSYRTILRYYYSDIDLLS